MQSTGMPGMHGGHPSYLAGAMNPYTGMPMPPAYGGMGMTPNYGYGPPYNPVDAAARAYHEGYDGHGGGRDSHRHRHSHGRLNNHLFSSDSQWAQPLKLLSALSNSSILYSYLTGS